MRTTPHRYYFGQLQRLILDAHKANPDARPSQLVAILAKQGHRATAKYVSKTIRAERKAMRWRNGRMQQSEAAAVTFRRGPAPSKGKPHDKQPAKKKRQQHAKTKPRAKKRPNTRRRSTR